MRTKGLLIGSLLDDVCILHILPWKYPHVISATPAGVFRWRFDSVCASTGASSNLVTARGVWCPVIMVAGKAQPAKSTFRQPDAL